MIFLKAFRVFLVSPYSMKDLCSHFNGPRWSVPEILYIQYHMLLYACPLRHNSVVPTVFWVRAIEKKKGLAEVWWMAFLWRGFGRPPARFTPRLGNWPLAPSTSRIVCWELPAVEGHVGYICWCIDASMCMYIIQTSVVDPDPLHLAGSGDGSGST